MINITTSLKLTFINAPEIAREGSGDFELKFGGCGQFLTEEFALNLKGQALGSFRFGSLSQIESQMTPFFYYYLEPQNL